MLPSEVLAELEAARRGGRRPRHRLRLRADGRKIRVLRLWPEGFAVADADALRLRGLVDLYDGARHLSQCLIVATDAAEGEVRYEFKRVSAASATQPRDFAPDEPPPAGLLPRD